MPLVKNFGLSSSAPATIRSEVKQSFTWVRDHSNPPTIGDPSGRDTDRSTLTDGPKEPTSGSGAARGGRETKQKSTEKGKNSTVPTKDVCRQPNNEISTEEGGRGDFRLFESGSNFPLISHKKTASFFSIREQQLSGRRKAGGGALQ